MISKAKINYIKALEKKKTRNAEGVFLAEGPKVVGDLLEVSVPQLIIHTPDWKVSGNALKAAQIIEVSDEELRHTSLLQHPQQVLAVFPQRQEPLQSPVSKLSLALDGVQDPGNMGTIVRIADWFGIEDIYCSTDTADIYNPKVVQATMGSLARVRVHYTNLPKLIDNLPAGFPVYGTVLDGDDIYATPLTDQGIIVMGNEGRGISEQLLPRLTHRLLIPHYPSDRYTTDSLNVAIATAVTCSEFRRRQRKI